MTLAKKIGHVLEQRYTGRFIQTEELETFLKESYAPKYLKIENMTKGTSTYRVKVSIQIKEDKLMEFYIQPFDEPRNSFK